MSENINTLFPYEAPYNKLAARKEIGAILYRLNDTTLNRDIRRRVLARHCSNLIETLPVKGFHTKLLDLQLYCHHDEIDAIREECVRLLESIPLTYGCIPAGSHFTLVGDPSTHGSSIYVKRKEGIETTYGDSAGNHVPGDTPVILINH